MSVHMASCDLCALRRNGEWAAYIVGPRYRSLKQLGVDSCADCVKLPQAQGFFPFARIDKPDDAEVEESTWPPAPVIEGPSAVALALKRPELHGDGHILVFQLGMWIPGRPAPKELSKCTKCEADMSTEGYICEICPDVSICVKCAAPTEEDSKAARENALESKKVAAAALAAAAGPAIPIEVKRLPATTSLIKCHLTPCVVCGAGYPGCFIVGPKFKKKDDATVNLCSACILLPVAKGYGPTFMHYEDAAAEPKEMEWPPTEMPDEPITIAPQFLMRLVSPASGATPGSCEAVDAAHPAPSDSSTSWTLVLVWSHALEAKLEMAAAAGPEILAQVKAQPVPAIPACNVCKAEGLKEAYTFPMKPEACVCLECAKPTTDDLGKVSGLLGKFQESMQMYAMQKQVEDMKLKAAEETA